MHPAVAAATDSAAGLAPLHQAEAAFGASFPAYAATAQLDALRQAEYGRLDAEGHIYLDYTGGGLYAERQLREHIALLQANVFGNPHSRNPTSQAMTAHVAEARRAVLDFFRADPAEYAAIFTANASGALKLVGEAYPFAPGSHYLLTADNHNSVNGIREFARARGATVRYLLSHPPAMRLDARAVEAALDEPVGDQPRLFAFPAQSNFSGVQHPLSWVAEARARGWDVLLDAAAFVPTNRLDLSAVQPDFVPISFYKMCGYPTGIGILLARRAALAKLCRPWFAGGTTSIVSVQAMRHFLVEDQGAFEDGTVDYLSLPAVTIGLRLLEQVGIEQIHERVHCLAAWLLAQMAALRHHNGRPVVRLHGPADGEARGGTIAFSVQDVEGALVDTRRIEELAAAAHLSLRTGGFCNPGSGEVAHQLTAAELSPYFQSDVVWTFEELRQLLAANHQKEAASVRVSLGIASNFADAYHFIHFLERFRDRSRADLGPAQPLTCAVAPTRDTP